FLLHKFLYTRHLAGYGVLDTAGNFEIVHLKPEEKRTEQHETLSPTMDLGLPVVIPHSVQPSDMIEWQGQPPSKKPRDKKQSHSTLRKHSSRQALTTLHAHRYSM